MAKLQLKMDIEQGQQQRKKYTYVYVVPVEKQHISTEDDYDYEYILLVPIKLGRALHMDTTATTPLLEGLITTVPTGDGLIGASMSENATEDAVSDADDTSTLLRRHFPRYFFDTEETLFPCDLNTYMVDQSFTPGCNGAAIKSEDGTTRLFYMNFYLADGGLQLCGCPCTCCTVGDHPYDLEVVIVEVDWTGTVSGVLFAPHGTHEHFWVREQADLEEILGGEGGYGARPQVFISRGKHGSYPVGGRVLRVFGFANDVCTDPVASEIPFVPLNQAAIDLDRIDGVFSGPRRKIRRDWSAIPICTMADVKLRSFLPAWSQIKEVAAPALSRLCYAAYNHCARGYGIAVEWGLPSCAANGVPV